MKYVFLILTIIFNCLSYAVETRGILEPLEGKSIVVGESYPFKLTLIPFEEGLINKEDLKGTSLFNLFYVVDVKKIEASENNFDAVEVLLDLVLVKGAEIRNIYIWNLKDRNIPIEIKELSVNDVKLNTKNFILLKTPNVDFQNVNFTFWGYGILILVMLALFFYWVSKRMRQKDRKESQGVLSRLLNVSTHEDLEDIYRNRRQILLHIRSPETQKELRELISSYELKQYSKDWSSTDITGYLEKIKEVGREITRGA